MTYTDDGLIQHPRGVRRSKGPAVPQDEPSLFAQATSVPRRETVGMFHGTDPVESQAAAVRALPGRYALQARILEVIARMGPLTALDIEAMPEFADAGVYAVRRRASDLRTAGKLVKVGTRDGAAILDIPVRPK